MATKWRWLIKRRRLSVTDRDGTGGGAGVDWLTGDSCSP